MTHKASPIFFDGNKIVRLSDLPLNQAHLFSGWITRSSYIRLGEKNDYDCVSYDQYEYWYQNHFHTETELNELI